MGVHTLRYTDGRQTAGVSVQYADERDLNWIIDTPLELTPTTTSSFLQ